MTIEEKRQALNNFCKERGSRCRSCPLCIGTAEQCSFGAFGIIPKYEVERAYNLAFNGERNVQREEINHPDRYKSGKFECIDVMLDVFGAEAVKHFCILNAFKYLWRAEKKNGTEDVKKAVWYLNKYIELEGGEE